MKRRLSTMAINAEKYADLYTLPNLRTTGWDTFEKCPTKWALEFLTGYQSQNVFSKIGSLCHEVVEDKLKTIKDSISFDFDISLTNAMEKFSVKIPQKELENLYIYINLLDTFIGKRRIIDTEDEWKSEINGISLPCKGTIDCLIEWDEDTILILDHKTNRTPEGSSTWKEKLQPQIYSWYVRKMYPGKRILFCIGYINFTDFVIWETEDNTEEIENRLVNNFNEMVKLNFHKSWNNATKLNDDCRYCGYKDECPTATRALAVLKSDLEGDNPRIGEFTQWEQLAYLENLDSLLQSYLKDLRASIKEEMTDSQIRTYEDDNISVNLSTSYRREVSNIKDFLFTFMGIASTLEVEDIQKLELIMSDIFTAKIGGLDKLFKLLPDTKDGLEGFIQPGTEIQTLRLSYKNKQGRIQ